MSDWLSFLLRHSTKLPFYWCYNFFFRWILSSSLFILKLILIPNIKIEILFVFRFVSMLWSSHRSFLKFVRNMEWGRVRWFWATFLMIWKQIFGHSGWLSWHLWVSFLGNSFGRRSVFDLLLFFFLRLHSHPSFLLSKLRCLASVLLE